MHFRGEYAFLSNFYDAPITTRSGLVWPTVEHAYQAAKSTDPDFWELIHACRTPADAKRFGRTVVPRHNWNSLKIIVMARLIDMKFSQHPDLLTKLRTIDEPIVEDNWWHDNFWGSCTCPRCAEIPGRNELGRILTDCRNRI